MKKRVRFLQTNTVPSDTVREKRGLLQSSERLFSLWSTSFHPSEMDVQSEMEVEGQGLENVKQASKQHPSMTSALAPDSRFLLWVPLLMSFSDEQQCDEQYKPKSPFFFLICFVVVVIVFGLVWFVWSWYFIPVIETLRFLNKVTAYEGIGSDRPYFGKDWGRTLKLWTKTH